MARHQSTNTPKQAVAPEVIKATLVFIRPPAIAEPEAQTEMTQPLLAEPLETSASETEPDAQQTPTVAEPSASPVAEVPLSPPDTPPQAVAAQPTSASSAVLQDRVVTQLHDFQQNKLAALAAQAAKEFKQQQQAQLINTKGQRSFLTEEEKLQAKRTTTIDCSSATNQTTAVVLGLLGGQVRCSQPPPIGSFIQARLNKSAHLPAMQGQNEGD